MNKRIYLTLILPLIITSCSQTPKVLANKIFCFDTMVETKLYEGTKENSSEIEKLFKRYDAISDNFQSRDVTNVYSINHTNDEIEIDKDLYDLLKTSFDVQNEGGTYFNPLCGSLVEKWKESLKNKQILDENAKNDEILKINSSSFAFKENNVVQLNGEAKIDLGGIVKGYVLDKVYDYLKEENINSYLIDAGTSSLLLGEKKSKDGYFTVGISGLDNSYIKLKNCFVSTSGVAVQGVEIDGTTYSHIINPINGSAINLHDSVIVVSDKGYYSDAMSTSMMMNTIDEIKQIEIDYNIQTIVIKDNKIDYCHEGIEVLKH